ncbi:hypothetical protein Pmar_PMAR008552, partial [Perkinsus marinus ATCC 50983]
MGICGHVIGSVSDLFAGFRYLNPICQQMDAKLRKLKTTEEILTAIITHRGVMFVQNLVTAVE